MDEQRLKMPSWKDEDFVIEKIKKTEWKEYQKKYPNLSWGTCVIANQDNEFVVQRFVSKEKCLFYCTAPTLLDLGYDVAGKN